MAYSEKYYITFCTKDGRDARFSFLKNDYEGSSTELTGQPVPVTINYDSEDDFKFSPIRASSCEVNMVFDEDDGVGFEDIWTADEREYKGELVVDSILQWTGYLIPNGFQYAFVGGKYNAQATFSDGLGTLEDYIFRDENTNKPYGNSDLTYNDGFLFPWSLIATEILRKLDLDLDLWCCVNSYEQTMAKTGDTRDADPLSASYVNVKTYIKESEEKDKPYWSKKGEEWNCKEVLENLLHIFGARIYQEKGVWRIISIDSLVDYGTGATQLYWRKYNTLNVYLGYETINDLHTIPCNNSGAYLLGNDHTLSMDYVYGAFRMNYEYTFLRDGDSPLNLLPNGNFEDFTNDSKLAAPTGWYRWRLDNKWHIRLQEVSVTPPSLTNGIETAIEIGTQKTGIDASGTDPNSAIWTALMNESPAFAAEGGRLSFEIWNRYRYNSPDMTVQYAPMYRLTLNTLSGTGYYLRNDFYDGKFQYSWAEIDIEHVTDPFGNILGTKQDVYFFYLNAWQSVNDSDLNSNVWHHFQFELPPAPQDGFFQLSIHGLAASSGRRSPNFPPFRSWTTGAAPTASNANFSLTDKWRVVREDWADQGGNIPRLQVTGIVLGLIPNEDEYAQEQDFIYENPNPRYTYEVDPITIYNGDIQSRFHISNIVVPTNTGEGKNFWDTINDGYGKSSLGLLTVKQIMRQYFKPYRILEGSVRLDNATFGGVYEIPTLTGIRFMLQRASFDVKRQVVSEGTFIQVGGETLPEGGTEGGNNLFPNWQATGVTYCEKENDVNTGYIVIEEEDVNPNSETYGEFREVVTETQDLTACPLNLPWLYYFGVDDVSLEIENLNTYPVTQVASNEVQVSFDNDGTKYLYFVHRQNLGVVERVYTPTQPSNVVSDWVYLADITVNGYIYRVFRTDYTMIPFEGYLHNFVFSGDVDPQISGTPFLMTFQGDVDKATVCSFITFGTALTFYFTPTGNLEPSVGQTVYNDKELTQPRIQDQIRWYKIGDSRVIQLDTTGEVLNIENC